MALSTHTFRAWLTCASLCVAAPGLASAFDFLPNETASRGGLCVVVGAEGSGEPVAELLAAGPWAVHLLDPGAEAVAEVRGFLADRGLYGRAAAEVWGQARLPYADHLVNLLVVREQAAPPDRAELRRVLAPGGVCFVVTGEGVERFVGERPPGMGEWTHPWNDSTGSLASSDSVLAPPNAHQWIAGPPFSLVRRNAAGTLLSAGGRVFAITQNVPANLPGGRDGVPNHLSARDAFNGLPLWSRVWEGPLSGAHWLGPHSAVVATADRVYATRENAVVALDAADGSELYVWETPATPRKLVHSEGRLVAEDEGGLTGFDLEAGLEAWRFEAGQPINTLADGGRVFAIAGARQRDGRWLQEVIALDLRDGGELWRAEVESEYTHVYHQNSELRIQFAAGGIVCLIERHALRALDAGDGRELWRRESGTQARQDFGGGGSRGGADSRQVGHFYSGGEVWIRQLRASGGREAPETWLALDPATGEVRRELSTAGAQGVISTVDKVSCQPLTATARYVLDSRLATIWDRKTGERSGWKFARGACQIGTVPANGLLYVPPNVCGCLDEQLIGFLALVHSEDAGLESILPADLEKGAAYGAADTTGATEETGAGRGGDESEADEEWPLYRRDGRRGASLPSGLGNPAALREEWRADLAPGAVEEDGEWSLQFGACWTAPTAAGGLLLLAEPQAHRVIALDAETGEKRWSYTAGGRVLVPPALHRGLALFGANDGWVYALRAADGELAWRFRAAPSDRRIVAYGQLESSWPVSGGVVIHGDIAYAAAGRAVDAGGGFVVHAFEPESGRIVWTSRVPEARYGNLDPLVSDGRYLYVMDRRIDPATGEVSAVEGFRYGQNERGSARVEYPEGVRYLRGGKRGMLENSWTRLSFGLRYGQSAWTWGDGVEGEILAFDESAAFVFQIDSKGEDSRGRPRMWASPNTRGGGDVLALEPGSGAEAWSVGIEAPAQVEAMLAAADALVLAGPLDRAKPEGPGFLRVLDRENGEELRRIELPAAPAHDGLAAARGRLAVVLKDGSVLSFRSD